jgi:hypothetical protein
MIPVIRHPTQQTQPALDPEAERELLFDLQMESMPRLIRAQIKDFDPVLREQLLQDFEQAQAELVRVRERGGSFFETYHVTCAYCSAIAQVQNLVTAHSPLMRKAGERIRAQKAAGNKAAERLGRGEGEERREKAPLMREAARLKSEGHSDSTIARLLRVSTKTLQRWRNESKELTGEARWRAMEKAAERASKRAARK